MNAPLPRIIVEPEFVLPPLDVDGDALAFLVGLAVRQRDLPGAVIGKVLSGLAEEGRRFAMTPSGARWRAMLVSSELASKGWALWNMLDMDSLVAVPAEHGDTPAAMLEDVLRTLHAARLDELARMISETAIEDWVADA